MAYQIIQHRVMKPREYAVHFKCSCGCEFWADQDSVHVYRTREGLKPPNFHHYETRCPECTGIAYSTEAAVPKSDVFTE